MSSYIKRSVKYIVGQALFAYFYIRHLLPVWLFLNRRSRRLYQKHPQELNDVQKRIIRDLQERGAAATHIDELFPGENLLPRFQAYASELEKNAKTKGTKPYLRYFFDPVPTLDFSNPLFSFAVRPQIVDTVNGYLDVWSEFYFFVMNKSLPVGDSVMPKKSQRWHRDFEDKKMCKVFLYLSDVDEHSGPFIYAEESHYGKRFGRTCSQKPPLGAYPPAEDIEEKIPAAVMKTYTGPAGTIIFCDTSGIHRGGYATQKERLMLTLGFRTAASPSETRYRLPEGFEKEIHKKISYPPARAALVVRKNSPALKLFKRCVSVPEYY